MTHGAVLMIFPGPITYESASLLDQSRRKQRFIPFTENPDALFVLDWIIFLELSGEHLAVPFVHLFDGTFASSVVHKHNTYAGAPYPSP